MAYREAGNEVSSVRTVVNALENPPGNPPKPAHKPDTGTNSGAGGNLVMWLCMAGLSYLVLGILLVKRRQND